MSDIDWTNVTILLDVIHKAAGAGTKYNALATEADFELQDYIATARTAADERAKAKAQAEAEARAAELARQQDLLDKAAAQAKVDAEAAEKAKAAALVQARTDAALAPKTPMYGDHIEDSPAKPTTGRRV